MNRFFVLFLLLFSLAAQAQREEDKYAEVSWPTPNIAADTINELQGIVLHHTAVPTVLRSLMTLTDKRRGVGAHCVIDTDGTRYILCPPTAVTFHAGLSCLHGRESCNYFTVGVEFQGNTLRAPLTEEQVESGIEYLLPIIRQYHIPLSNIVTHEMVRTAYKERHPEVRCYGKVDITPVEYHRFMAALEKRLVQEEAAEKANKAKARPWKKMLESFSLEAGATTR